MKYTSIIYHIVILTMIVPFNATAGFSLKKVYAALGAQPYKEIIEKEYPLDTKQKKLVLENNHGNITIKTDWQKNSIALTATIHKSKPDENPLQIIDESSAHEFTLRTLSDNTQSKAKIDYELIVPQNLKLQLSTNKGHITVNDTHGITMATTDCGSIYFNNIQNKARATTTTTGSIYCKDCTGALYTSTNRGNIKMSEVQNTVIAKTDMGKINLKCKDLPEKSKLNLKSSLGNIAISLPQECNADIKATTEQGTCICDHYITLRSQTTKLNDHAWRQFKRSIDGTIGQGITPIQISSIGSNIRIMANKIS